MNLKKNKIQEICNYIGGNVLNVFTDDLIKKHYIDKVLSLDYEGSERDEKVYYSVNSDVKISLGNGKFIAGKIISTNYDKKISVVKIRVREEKHVNFKNIFRFF